MLKKSYVKCEKKWKVKRKDKNIQNQSWLSKNLTSRTPENDTTKVRPENIIKYIIQEHISNAKDRYLQIKKTHQESSWMDKNNTAGRHVILLIFSISKLTKMFMSKKYLYTDSHITR